MSVVQCKKCGGCITHTLYSPLLMALGFPGMRPLSLSHAVVLCQENQRVNKIQEGDKTHWEKIRVGIE